MEFDFTYFLLRVLRYYYYYYYYYYCIWTEGWYGSGGHSDTNMHALLNTIKLPVYSTCRLCQQTQTLNLFVVVQGQCPMGCAAD
jgi:hypothetical protein